MAGTLSKRQQARNEKLLQNLVHAVPGNNQCADCSALNPAWASWSLGIFLCMRCAAIHRKLGTHISKVKSLSMDSWSNEQVENMSKVGNIASNKVYNPQNKQAAIPIDADEADSVMERFIRQKYTPRPANVNGTKRYDDGGRVSDEGPPPPLPPKTSAKKLSFRSASSIFPLSSRAKKQAAMRDALTSPRDGPRSPSPHLTNKASKVFGANVECDKGDVESKLAKLRDMGFPDGQRNATVLKGVNGSLERAIEALVRLGDVERQPGSLITPRESSLRATRSLTPITPTSSNGPSGGLQPERPTTPSTVSSNPFDMVPAQPQSSQSTGTLQNKNPYYSTNPFGLPGQQNDLNQAFQNMSLAPPLPLFPNHTGGIPGQTNQPTYYQAVAVAVPAPAPAQNYPPSFNSNLTYPPPTQSLQQAPAVQAPWAETAYNPFLTQQPQQMIPHQPQQVLSVNTVSIPPAFGSNPFTRSPTRIASPLGQIPEQQAQTSFNAAPQAQPYPQPQMTNPFFTQTTPTAQGTFQPQRPDKAAILALYNYPQLAPRPAVPEQNQPAVEPQAQPDTQPRSASSPLPGNKNPFLTGSGGPAAPSAAASRTTSALAPATNGHGHGSHDSVSLGMDMAWANGRHSPDAFASLSARQ